MKPDFGLDFLCRMRVMKRYGLAFALLFLFLLVIYGNSFDSSWHFDDFDNIVHNPAVHVHDLSAKELYKSFFGIMNTGRWSRPFSYLSFAVNYHFGGLDVFGYHLVNFTIHCLAAIFLFLLIYQTLELPLLRRDYARHAYSISLMASLLWAVHPIHVSAVTYIVQRMASMAALFYFMAMFFYVKARTSSGSRTRQIIFACCCGISAVMALASKENAAMLPASLFLYEILLIQGYRKESRWAYAAAAAAVCLLIFGIGLLYADWSSLKGGYDNFRPFTLWERVLTEPRVILFYVSLLFYPVSSRLMLCHDIDISKTLFDPWTTAASILILLIMTCAALAMARKKPLIAYSILFFLLNHVIEASFLSLELVYEHRNYLPSAFLFVPVALLVINAMDRFWAKGVVFYVLIGSMICILIVLGVTTRMQNDVYRDEFVLWSDNVAKTPNLHRPLHNLGVALMMRGRCGEALESYQRALTAKIHDYIYRKYDTYLSMADCYILMGEDDHALTVMQKAEAWYTRHPELHRRKAEIMMRKGNLSEAERLIQAAIGFKPRSASYHVTYGRILLARGKPDPAIREAQQAIRLDGRIVPAFVLLSEAFRDKKDLRIADHFKRVSEMIMQWN